MAYGADGAGGGDECSGGDVVMAEIRVVYGGAMSDERYPYVEPGGV